MAWPVYIPHTDGENDDGLRETANNDRRGSVDRGETAAGGQQRASMQRGAVCCNHEIPSLQNIDRNARRYSYGDIYQRYRPAVSNTIRQRHSMPSCQINQNIRHSWCFRLNRGISLENSDLHSSSDFSHQEYPVSFRRNSTSILNTSRQFFSNESHNEFVSNGRRRFSIGQSLLFKSQNSVGEWNEQHVTTFTRPEYFLTFLAYHLEETGLHVPEYLNKDFIHCGELTQSIYYLIDAFSISVEREMVLHLALRVQLPVDFHTFLDLLDGIDKGTPTPESLVTLFFFCGDLAVRALHANDEATFMDIVTWTLYHLRRLNILVSPSKKPPYKIAITACIFGILAIFAIMKHNK